MSKKYKHLFFDLDHTLWDHHTNANETLEDLYHHFKLNELATFTIPQFQETFSKINHALWHQYHLGLVDQSFIRKQRFRKVLKSLGLNNYGSDIDLADKYLAQCPRKSNLMPFALDALNYLRNKYPMTIITNGFSEVQDIKLSSSGLRQYFDRVITSEQAGWLKPHRGIFEYAVRHAGVLKSDCLMIGDNPDTDIEGARKSGIDQIYYDPTNRDKVWNATYKIDSLLQLKELL